MLSVLFGRKPDHPMADMKSAQALLDELPKGDAHKALGEIAEWIESVSADEGFRPDHQFAVLRLLDEAAQPHARKLARDYFSPGELGKFQENRLWLALDNFYRHSADAYEMLFDRYSNGGKGGNALREHAPLIVVRALHALSRRMKYASARYSPVDGRAWSVIAKLYRHAEQRDYLDVEVAPYADMAPNASVRRTAGHLLGWYGCGAGSLSPLDIHFAERIIGQYSNAITVDAKPDANSLFSFDLDRPVSPIRTRVNGSAHPSLRYVSMTALLPKLESLLLTLEKNVVPDDLNLGGTYDAEAVGAAARYLCEYVAAPPLRRTARRSIKVDMNVVSGFDGVVERAGTVPGTGDERLVYWEVEDISSSGFRAVLPAQGVDGIRIGTLLGVRPGGVPHWGVAVVRRLMRDEANLLHVGAEMLSSRVTAVDISRNGAPADGQAVLWLQAKQGEPEGEVRLLLKADTFSMHRSLQAGVDGKNYLLIPTALQERSLDYELARFRPVEQEAGGDGDY